MVDCGSPRCAQERRSCRRELQSWSKKLPLVLGLERIAADYVDKETAKQFINPYPEWEQQLSRDFVSSKRCFHCEKKLPNIYKRIQRIIDDAKKGKENSGKICLRSLQDLMPFCLDFYTRGFGRELFSDVVKAHFLTAMQQPEVKDEVEPQASYPASSDIFSKLRVPHLAAARSGKKQDLMKQAYPEEEADSAISDVRCGKVGNKRAAMIYGNPCPQRSKMVKLEPNEVIIADDEDDSPVMTEVELPEPSHLHHLPAFKLPEPSMFGLGDSLLSHGPLPLFPTMPYPISLKLEPDDHNFIQEQRLNQIRRMHNLNGLSEVRPRPAHANQLKLPLLIHVVRKLVQQKFMEIKQNYGKNFNSFEMKSKVEPELFSPFGPYLPTFSPYLVSSHNDENITAPVYKHIMESIYTNMMKEDSPLPKPFGKVNESSRIGDTLKDIIAKTISEKIRFRDGSSDESSLPSTPDIHKNVMGKSKDRSEVSQSSKGSKSYSGGCSPPKRLKKESSKSRSRDPSSTPDSSGNPTKKTRPKRGQYRKYNSQLLMDAVKAVQRGEMSVHRAGSYFGVPHSTLEYKVKERHLLRQKKPRDSQSPSVSVKSDNSATTTPTAAKESSPTLDEDGVSTSKRPVHSSSAQSSTSSSLSPPPLCISSHQKSPAFSTSKSLPSSSAPSPPLPISSSALGLASSKEVGSLAWFQPYLSTPTPHLDSSVGLIPSSITLNNSASELLRKLQHKVQAKGSSFPADSAFELPCSKDRVFDLTQTASTSSAMSDRLALFNQSV